MVENYYSYLFPSGSPNISWNKKRTMLFVISGRSTIIVFFSKPFPEDEPPCVVDITSAPEMVCGRQILIRDRNNHNRIAASYNPSSAHLLIRHYKSRYIVMMPPGIKELHCGGNKVSIYS